MLVTRSQARFTLHLLTHATTHLVRSGGLPAPPNTRYTFALARRAADHLAPQLHMHGVDARELYWYELISLSLAFVRAQILPGALAPEALETRAALAAALTSELTVYTANRSDLIRTHFFGNVAHPGRTLARNCLCTRFQ